MARRTARVVIREGMISEDEREEYDVELMIDRGIFFYHMHTYPIVFLLFPFVLFLLDSSCSALLSCFAEVLYFDDTTGSYFTWAYGIIEKWILESEFFKVRVCLI